MKYSKKILITGSSGFIGSNLVNFARSNGCIVYTLDLKKNNGIVGDIRTIDWKTIELKNMDAVVHLAAKISVMESINDPTTYHEINVDATEKLFQACVDAKVKKIIFASSAAVYGESESEIKVIGEEGSLTSPYAETKLMGEYLADKIGTENSRIIPIRLFNIYGPGQEAKNPYSSVIPLFIDQILEGIPINIYGDGEQTRDFIHVSDVCRSIMTLIESDLPSGTKINIGSGKGISINQLVNIILEIFKREGLIIPEIIYGNKRSGDVKYSIADINELKRYLDLDNFINFEVGLKELIIEKISKSKVEL